MDDLEEHLRKEYVFDADSGCWTRSKAEDFMYSDGDEVENRIFTIIRDAHDLGSLSRELTENCVDWPSLYHLSPMRSNLLRPIRKALQGRILEVGAGMGAITRFLGEQGGEVLAIEGSTRRAMTIKERCRDLKNVTVVADSFHNFDAIINFDVVVLIGVLEYARMFFISDFGDPVDAMLKHARSLLRPGGLLIVAIENQLGLKYFAAHPEDHTGQPMYGIEDLYGDNTVVTFGQNELKEKLRLAGFPEQNWWYPFPDYKLPVTVFSSRIAENDVDLTPILINSVSSDPQNFGKHIFSLERAWGVVFRNGLVPSLANSFLIMASDTTHAVALHENNILGYYFSVNRRPEFAKEIIFEKSPIGGIKIKKQMLLQTPASYDDNPISIELRNEEFLEGVNWYSQLCRILNKPGWGIEDIDAWAHVWYDALQIHGNLALRGMKPPPEYRVPGDLIDAIPRNLIVTKNTGPRFFDQEWRLKSDIEWGYMIFRGLFLELIHISNVARPAAATPINIFELFRSIAQLLDVRVTKEDVVRYVAFENDILYWVTGLKNLLTPDELINRSLIVRGPISDRAKDEQIISLMQELNRLQHELTAISRSKAWQFIQLLRRLRYSKIN
jgi:SAM-dependent methyltransferase